MRHTSAQIDEEEYPVLVVGEVLHFSLQEDNNGEEEEEEEEEVEEDGGTACSIAIAQLEFFKGPSSP